MALKVCAEPGCPKLQPEARCSTHRSQRENLRGTRQQRGYGVDHERLGREYQRRMDDGERFNCWRCGRPLGTRRNIDWQLGHDDHDRSQYRGPEHPACNQATSGRRISPVA